MFKHVNSLDDEECGTFEDSSYDDDDISVEGVNLEKIRPVLEKSKQAVETFEELFGEFCLECKSCAFDEKDLLFVNANKNNT